MASRENASRAWWLPLLVGLVAFAPAKVVAQAGIVPRQSVLFTSAHTAVVPMMMHVDSVNRQQRVQAAITWGLIGGLIGFIISSDADGSAIPRAPAVIGLTLAGVLGGLLTGGKGGD